MNIQRLFGPSGPYERGTVSDDVGERRETKKADLSPFGRVNRSTVSAYQVTLLDSRLLLMRTQCQRSAALTFLPSRPRTFFFFSPGTGSLFAAVWVIPMPREP